MIEALNLNKTYTIGENNVVCALENITLTINDGEMAFIMGKSGSGKSTLLHILSGLDKPDSGRILYNNTDISLFSENELSTFRQAYIGFVFQDYHLIPELTAEENIKYPVLLNKKSIDEEFFSKLIDTLELSDRLKHLPSQLSGGQQQRVAIARALISNPSVIFCDEPTGNLDSEASACVSRLLRQISQEFGKTILIVTHDSKFAELGDRVIHLCDGRIIE